VSGPDGPQPSTVDDIVSAGDQFWPLRAFRELDDALLRLRFNDPTIGTVVLKSSGDAGDLLAVDATLIEHRDHWLVREIVNHIKRTLNGST
jgi:benzoyl-CoA-dihydrodiol lyase